MAKPDKCFICGNTGFRNIVPEYFSCTKCGHEILSDNANQGFIINDILDEKEIQTLKSADKFKIRILKKCIKKFENILDVGSASGKFLYHVKKMFTKYSGLEITQECIDFSTKKLRLNIISDINELTFPIIENVTFWHSLEHIPVNEIEKILDFLSKKTAKDTRIIISVPNSYSFQYWLFRRKYPFFDFPNHIHQFSPESLGLLMDKYGFKKERKFFSFSYTLFGYIQGFVNLFNKQHNFLYYHKKRGFNFGYSKIKLKALTGYNILLSGIFLIPSILLTCFEKMNLNKSSVLTHCFKQK